MINNFEEKKIEIKLIRDKFLKFHKILMDFEREIYEKEFGTLTPGKFLELLLSDDRFAWLRTISTLIVKIDEAFDLNDGLSREILDGFYTEMRDMFDENSKEYQTFKEKLTKFLPLLPEANKLSLEIQGLIK